MSLLNRKRASSEQGKIKVKFFWKTSLILSIIFTVVGTIVLNLLLNG